MLIFVLSFFLFFIILLVCFAFTSTNHPESCLYPVRCLNRHFQSQPPPCQGLADGFQHDDEGKATQRGGLRGPAAASISGAELAGLADGNEKVPFENLSISAVFSSRTKLAQ